MPRPPRSRLLLLVLGALALAAGGVCVVDATRVRPTDGAMWLLGGKEIRVIDLVPGGPAEVAGIQIDDVIEGIAHSPIRSPGQAAQLLQQQAVGDTVSYIVRRDNAVSTVRVPLASTRATDLSTYWIYCGLGIVYFVVGLVVFWKNSHQLAARLFYLLCSVFLIFFFSASERTTEYYLSELFSTNLSALSSLLVPPLFLHFFLVFPQVRPLVRRHRWLPVALYALPLLFYAHFTHDQFFGDHPAKISGLQQMALGLYFTLGLASLVASYLSSRDALLRQRVKVLTLGTVLGVLPFLIFNIAAQILLGRDDFALLGAVPMVLVPVSFGYSIARYRLMDVEVIVRRSLVYAVLTGAIVGAYLVIVVLVGRVVLNLSGQNSQLFAIIATLMIAMAFNPARDRIQAFLDRRFFREKHDLQEAMNALALSIPRTIERPALEELVGGSIGRLLHPSHFGVALSDGGVLAIADGSYPVTLAELSDLLVRRRSPLTAEMLDIELGIAAAGTGQDTPLGAEVRALRALGLRTVVPAFAGERLVAALCLGDKRSESPYSSAELDMLTIVAGQMAVQLENTRLYDEVLERKRLEEELATARAIQQRLLPSVVPNLPGFDVAALNLPSRQVSGDYYDFVPLSGGTCGFVISDVSGKGLPASLLASNLQASLRALATIHSSPGAILTAVNHALYESTDPDRFATLFAVAVQPGTGSLVYSNAGHNPPLVRRRDGRHEWLEEGATPLGAFPGIEYPEGRVDVYPGDVVVLYTDGLTEAADEDDVQFGPEGLRRVVEEQVAVGADALAITGALREAVLAHSGGGHADDDLTIIVLRATAPTEREPATSSSRPT